MHHKEVLDYVQFYVKFVIIAWFSMYSSCMFILQYSLDVNMSKVAPVQDEQFCQFGQNLVLGTSFLSKN